MDIVLRPLGDATPHEQVKADHVLQAMQVIQAEKRPLIVAQSCRNIWDGHHRYNALRKLDARHVPCIEVNSDDTEEIEVTAWRDDEAVTPEAVRDAASHGSMMPPKTCKHLLKFPVPPIRVALANLLLDASAARVHAPSSRLRDIP